MNYPFRTIIDVKPLPFSIDYSTPLLMLGSCFTDNIGNILVERKFPVLVNPFGVVYNPVSVALVLNRISDGIPYIESDLQNRNDQWFSFHHHTSFSSHNQAKCLKNINSSLAKAHRLWNKSDRLIITLGTARVYRYNETSKPVANCHKIPAREFTHELLTVNEIVGEWNDLLNKQFASKPSLRVLFTVSPVRHWKDGAVGNQISKSTLLLAISQLVSMFPHNVFYFPSYEIMMDDLRDYRFYADDMLHPNSQAVRYIWKRFASSVLSNEAGGLLAEIEKLQKAANHKPFNIQSDEYRKHVALTLDKITAFVSKHSAIDFSEEISNLKNRTI